jgi:hypothetical protein
MSRLGCAAALTAGLALLPASFVVAREVIPTPHFDSVGVRGDAQVTIRHGAEQRVVLVKGNTRLTRIGVDEPRSGSLEIEDCTARCPQNYEIITPEIAGLAVKGDGVIKVEGNFAERDRLGLAVAGDGDIEARAVPARTVDAAVNGDGHIAAAASEMLTAAVNGEGTVTYYGRPRVRSVVNGDGAVQPSR